MISGVYGVYKIAVNGVLISAGIYGFFIAILTIPFFQNQVIYLNSITLTGSKDLNVPEQWGFLPNQVTPFAIETPDGEVLQAWHVLQLEVYRQNEQELLKEPAGFVKDVKSRLSFKLLHEDPDALVVLYFHGAAGTLGSGYRPPSYRAIYSGAPDKIHVISIDYRGFGRSTGKCSEQGLLTDAITLVEWTMGVAGVPASRITFFAQSLGTAVTIAVADHFVNQSPPTLFSGMVLVAPFADVATLTATYSIAGILPLLAPVARFPTLLKLLNSFIRDKWPSQDRIADFVTRCESMEVGQNPKYHITIIHARDDWDIPWVHSQKLFWRAVNASTPERIGFEDLEKIIDTHKTPQREGEWSIEWKARNGIIRQQIIRYGEHDRTMSFPVVSLAVLRAFHEGAHSSAQR